MDTYLFIDLSYFIFHQYYSKKGYFQFQELSIENLINNEEFLKIFSDFEKKFNIIKKKLKLDKNVKIILARDCRRRNIWRNELLPSYKASRKVNTEVGEFFIYTYDNIIKNYNCISVDNCEADDIIGIITKNLYKNNKIYIITDDLDYLQLLNTNVEIYNLKFKNLKDKSIGENDLLKKIILGDKSDNIPSIHKKLGEKTVEKYINNNDMLESKLENIEIKEQFELNRKLIDMNYIPDIYKKKILEEFKKIKY